MANSNYSVKDAPDPDLLTGATVLDRVKLQLNFKPYYSDEGLSIFIYENNLDPEETYNKDTDEKNMLKVVYEVLDTLANDISMFRKIETEFATEDQAYKYLQQRLKDLRERIDAIPDPVDPKADNSNITFMFYNQGVQYEFYI